MKQVIFFHPYFSDGGVERTNLGLAKGLIESGYTVTFLTTSYTNHFMKEIDELNIELMSFGDKKVSSCVFEPMIFSIFFMVWSLVVPPTLTLVGSLPSSKSMIILLATLL